MDPKQVVFTDKQVDIAEGVLNGDFDVGFVRTDQLEHFGLTLDDVKVLNPRSYVMDNGDLFPFLTSTAVFPEWPVAALPHVPPVIAIEVQEALIAMQVHAETGRQISTGAAYAPMRCDTTEDLAIFALEASGEGNIAAFRNPKSYFGVRTMQEAAGFLKKDEDGNWKCTRHVLGELFASIDCPEGHFRVDADEFKDQCAKAGLPCKEGYDCFCRPCIKGTSLSKYIISILFYEEPTRVLFLLQPMMSMCLSAIILMIIFTRIGILDAPRCMSVDPRSNKMTFSSGQETISCAKIPS